MADTEQRKDVALVTGGSSGIGLATAGLLAAEGYAVGIVGRSKDRLDGAKETLVEAGARAGDVLAIAADLADPVQATSIVHAAIEHWGGIDVVFNNAGLAPNASIDQHHDAMVLETVAANISGPALIIVDAWKHWVEEKKAGRTRRRVIVSTGSVAAIDPFPGFFIYGASKAAVELLGKAAANEGEDLGVKAFTIGPGAVETALLRGVFSKDALSENEALKPEDVAEAVVRTVRGDHDDHNGGTMYLVKEGDGVKRWWKER